MQVLSKSDNNFLKELFHFQIAIGANLMNLMNLMIFGAQTPGRKTVYNCQVCGKEGQGMQIRDHIEANHLEGIVMPCNHCEKTFRSRSAMRGHRRIYHK